MNNDGARGKITCNISLQSDRPVLLLDLSEEWGLEERRSICIDLPTADYFDHDGSDEQIAVFVEGCTLRSTVLAWA